MTTLIYHRFAPPLSTCSKKTLISRVENPNKRKNQPEKLQMNQWWKKTLGQSLNSAGVASFLNVAVREPHLAIPHLSVRDLRWINWSELGKIGFRGVVFDKDNTLTSPYSLCLWPALSGSFARCNAVFPGKVAVFSNSAGLYQYDPDGSEARTLEESIGGIHVVRHELKKPAGTAEDIEKFFGCPASDLIMVGDRHFTDIVYGNRHGFLTILTEPLNLSLEPFIVKQVLIITKADIYTTHLHHSQDNRRKKENYKDFFNASAVLAPSLATVHPAK